MRRPVNLSTLKLKEKVFERFSDKTDREESSNVNKFELCGDYTINLINSLNPGLVLDLGCGDNQYKSKIQNLIGIDLVTDWVADIVGDISDLSQWEDGSVDACLCMGSVNFGNDELIGTQLHEIHRVLREGGLCVMRGNMNDHLNKTFYGWNANRIIKWTEKLGWKVYHHPEVVHRLNLDGSINHNWKDRRSRRSSKRLFWIWQK